MRELQNQTPQSQDQSRKAEVSSRSSASNLSEPGSDQTNGSGDTPLQWAIRFGHTAVVKLLLERNDIDPNANDNGHTQLMIAVQKGYKEVVWLLLGKDKVDPNFPNRSGETPLITAAGVGMRWKCNCSSVGTTSKQISVTALAGLL
jgi:ankyrin repeat protein